MLAVSVKDLKFSYGSGKNIVHVLVGVNLSVLAGKIYGLLGPSGSGKTTLLRCVVGRLRFSTGVIKVFDKVPGTRASCIPGPIVGYMPQDPSLFPELTLEQTLQYFGRITLMNQTSIEERINFLIKYLDLPDRHEKVKHMSGGQRRRVSLAAALIHKPRLLILDEPTVGVDPVLRKQIWTYLSNLSSQEGMTIIITTHYIDEARQADYVGFMRNGQILAENTPEELIEQHRRSSLSQVFVSLCVTDEKSLITAPRTAISDLVAFRALHQYSKQAQPPFYKQSIIRMKAMARKNLIRLINNMVLLLASVIIPSFIMTVTLIVLGHEFRDIPVAVINKDTGESQFATRFINGLSNVTVKKIYMNDSVLAKRRVDDGIYSAVIELGEHFSTAFSDRFQGSILASNTTIMNSAIMVYADNFNIQVFYILVSNLLNGLTELIDGVFQGENENALALHPPFVFHKAIYGSYRQSFTEFVAPGLLVSLVCLASMGTTAFSVVLERKEGTLERSLISGAQPWEVLASHLISLLAVVVSGSLLMLFITVVVFGMPCRGYFLIAESILITHGVCGMALGLVFSSLSDNTFFVNILSCGITLMSVPLSGVLWPTQAIPKLVRFASFCHFQTYAVTAIRSVMFRGWGLKRATIWICYATNISWALGLFLIAIIAFHVKK